MLREEDTNNNFIFFDRSRPQTHDLPHPRVQASNTRSTTPKGPGLKHMIYHTQGSRPQRHDLPYPRVQASNTRSTTPKGPGLKHMIYHTQDEHDNHYNIDLAFIKLEDTNL